MSDTLFDISQYQSQSHISYSPDWRDATGTDPAWEQPVLEADLGTNPQAPVDDAITQWRTGAEFILTLQSGHDVEVTFVPCLVGKRRMHEFSFTGPISPTGFKSHFVLAVEAEHFPHPRDYAQAYAEEVVAQHQKKLKKAKSTKRAHQQMTNEQDDCGNSAIPVKAVEVLPQVMTEAEARQCIAAIKGDVVSIRTRLVDLEERRGFEALGYPNMSACMKAEFKQSRPTLVKELKAGRIEQLFLDVPIGTFLESHFRPLSKLKPEYYKPAFDQASILAGDRPVRAKDVSLAVAELLRSVPGASNPGIVDHLKQKHPSLQEFAPGDVVEIKALKRSPLHPFNGMWAIIEHVGSFSYTVQISIARDRQQCKAEEITLIDDEYTADIKAVAQRIAALVQFELEPFDYAILELLQRSTCFTPRQLLYLERMEADYGKSN